MLQHQNLPTNQQPRPNRIVSLPSPLLQWCTNSFLDDGAAVAFAQTQHLIFDLLKNSYRVRSEVEFVWKEDEKTTAIASSLHLWIGVAYPCLMSMKIVDKTHPERGALDPRSYKPLTYALNNDNAAAASKNPSASSSPWSTRSRYRIGQPQNIAIHTLRTDETDENCARATELTKVLFESLPAATISLRITYYSLQNLMSLQCLIRLRTLTIENVRSLECLNEIARGLPDLHVLRIDGQHPWKWKHRLKENANDVLLVPPELEELYLGKGFQNFENRIVLHDNLRVVHYLGHTMPVQDWNLPSSLTELHLGDDFNSSIDGWLPPSSLRTLIFGWRFNQSLSRVVWPPHFERFLFGLSFSKSLVNVPIPDSMVHLELRCADEEKLPVTLPPILESLVMSKVTLSSTVLTIACDLPPTLKTIRLESRIFIDMSNRNWPDSMTELHINVRNMQISHFMLPPQLRVLELIGRGTEESENQLLAGFSMPSTLTSLTLSKYCICTISALEFMLHGCANSLRTLNLGLLSNASMSAFKLPHSLTHLELPSNWDCPVSDLPHFPSSLRYLKFGYEWNQSLSDSRLELPSSLRRLHFDEKWNQSTTPLTSILPVNLRELVFTNHGFGRQLFLNSLSQLPLPPYCRLVATFTSTWK